MITSKSNPRIKEIRLLKQAKHRRTRGEFFLEGIRLVEEALRQPLSVKKILYSPRLEESNRGASLLSAARKQAPGAEWLYVSDEVLGSLGDTQSHQGVLAVLEMKEYRWEELEERKGLILLLGGLQDPGNLGTIFRVAEAGGAAGLILCPQSADPYNPKAVRASMGSLLRLPFLVDQDPRESFHTLRRKGYPILAAAVRGGPPFWEYDFRQPTAVLFGQEGGGLSPDLLEGVDGLITIPMDPIVESLNVAMAAGLVVYEALRQKPVRTRTVGGER
jgi:TrmH family RNA methyltransferase